MLRTVISKYPGFPFWKDGWETSPGHNCRSLAKRCSIRTPGWSFSRTWYSTWRSASWRRIRRGYDHTPGGDLPMGQWAGGMDTGCRTGKQGCQATNELLKQTHVATWSGQVMELGLPATKPRHGVQHRPWAVLCLVKGCWSGGSGGERRQWWPADRVVQPFRGPRCWAGGHPRGEQSEQFLPQLEGCHVHAVLLPKDDGRVVLKQTPKHRSS